MIRHSSLQRLFTAACLAATALVSLAPAALADHGWGRVRYKETGRDWRWQRAQNGGPVIVRESSAGPAIAGLVGGFLLGQAFGHERYERRVVVHEHVYAPPPPAYRYYDPCADQYYDSLDDCSYGDARRHPRVVRVIEIRTGRAVGLMRWSDGDWRNCDDRGWDFGPRDRYSRDDDRRGRHWDDDDEDDGR